MKIRSIEDPPTPASSALRRWCSRIPGEPFRLFFPAGILASIVGVALWPLHYADLGFAYPGVGHSRIMLFGFFGAFFTGFLGTAGPRMLESKPLRGWECAGLFVFWAVSLLAYSLGFTVSGDGVVAAGFVVAACLGASRIRKRKDLPPPTFSLVLLGLGAGFVGLALHLLLNVGVVLPASALLYDSGKRLMYESFLLLPVLGVAPFFFPRFGGRHPSPRSHAQATVWLPRASLFTAIGVACLALQVGEVFSHSPLWGLARVAVVIAYAAVMIPLRFGKGQTGTLGRLVQIALVFAMGGLILLPTIPLYRVAWLHLLLGGGFGLITLCVGTWVIFGHSGVKEWGRRRLPLIRAAAALLILAIGTRVAADLLPGLRVSHLVYAAAAWTVGVLLWALKIVPRTEFGDPED